MEQRHPRTHAVMLARSEITLAVATLAEDHGLTFVEVVQALTDCLGHFAKHALRQERHPGNPDADADEL